jgi:hypothetical protein
MAYIIVMVFGRSVHYLEFDYVGRELLYREPHASWWGGQDTNLCSLLIRHVDASVGDKSHLRDKSQTLGDKFQQPNLLGSCVLNLTMNLLSTQEISKLDLCIDRQGGIQRNFDSFLEHISKASFGIVFLKIFVLLFKRSEGSKF